MPEADDDLEQLRQVIKFRKELDSQGLTSSYPLHAQFAENVRGGLLRAIRDILQESTFPQQQQAPAAAPVASPELTLPAAPRGAGRARRCSQPRCGVGNGKRVRPGTRLHAQQQRADARDGRRFFEDEDRGAASAGLRRCFRERSVGGSTVDGDRRSRHVSQQRASRLAGRATGSGAGAALRRLSCCSRVARRSDESSAGALREAGGRAHQGSGVGCAAAKAIPHGSMF